MPMVSMRMTEERLFWLKKDASERGETLSAYLLRLVLLGWGLDFDARAKEEREWEASVGHNHEYAIVTDGYDWSYNRARSYLDATDRPASDSGATGNGESTRQGEGQDVVGPDTGSARLAAS